ncbi:MAG: sugar ABC transporter ATP-binding protein, partial [Anaerolineae bacterium]|nr:sugar ABC transporter ATP-binding protein [Anaerolineae bacterium]
MSAPRATAPPLLEMRGITKQFPGVLALSDVNFSAAAGEIHALIGQNGAGKSTLMKVLAGVYQPNAGEIIIEGKPVRFQQPRAALRSGVGVVYQDLSLVPQLSVADNIFLGREAGGGILVDQPT